MRSFRSLFLVALLAPACGAEEFSLEGCEDDSEGCACFANGTCLGRHQTSPPLTARTIQRLPTSRHALRAKCPHPYNGRQ